MTTSAGARVSIRSYGAHPSQYGELRRAHGPRARGSVMLVHGGFWRARRGLEMTTAAATALAARGWSVWNVEYRRAQGSQQTLDDCSRSYDVFLELTVDLGIDSLPKVLVGHSAGGHLAAWVAGTHPAATRLDGLVTLNGVLDLELARQLGIGDSAVAEFLGPDASQDHLQYADAAIHPAIVPVRCLHSPSDERVPFEIAASYVAKAQRAGRTAELVKVPGPHTAVIEPDSPAWPAVLHAIEAPWVEERVREDMS